MPKPSSGEAELVRAIYGAAAEPGSWAGILGRLTEGIGAAAFLIYSGGAGRPGSIVQARLRHDLVEPCFRHYADNP